MVFLYGSRAHGVQKADSDVDLAVLFKKQCSEEEIFSQLTDVSLELSKMTGLDVNVLPILSSVSKPMLYYNAIAKGLPLFVEDKIAYARLRHDAIVGMEDFSLFGAKWQIEAARRNLSHG